MALRLQNHLLIRLHQERGERRFLGADQHDGPLHGVLDGAIGVRDVIRAARGVGVAALALGAPAAAAAAAPAARLQV